MAQQPLIVQRPTVSLIGGQELQKASGAGVPVPDLSNAFSQLANVLRAKQEEGDRLDETLQGEADIEAWRGRTTGKSPLDRYTNPPTINGSPVYRAAATNALEQNAISDIRSIYATQAGTIQTEVGTPTAQKMLRMKAAGDAIIDTIAPPFRLAARKYIDEDLAQREQQLLGEDGRRLEAAIEDGQNNRLKAAFDKGVSAASAGADWTEHTRELRAVLDEKVTMGKILPADAELEKKRLTNLVVAEGVHRTISTEAMKGNISGADLLQFGVSMDTGAPAELYADRIYEPGFEGDRFDSGQSGKDPSKRRIISADEFKTLVDDPGAAKAIANNIQELGRYLMSAEKANEEDMQLWDFIQNSQAYPDRVLPETLKTNLNKKVDLAIRKGALDSAEGRSVLASYTLATRTMAPELMRQLKAMTMGTFEHAQIALEMWNEMTTTINGPVETGQIVLQSVDQGDASLMDSATAAAADILRQGGGEENWRRLMLKLADTGKGDEFYANDFYEHSGRTQQLDNAIREAFLKQYGRQSMDAEFMREAKAAYRNSMILSGDVDQQVALDKVMERMFNRYTASPIFYRGIAASGDLSNPDIPGYRQPSWFSSSVLDKNQWVNDFAIGQLHNFRDSEQVTMTPEGLKALDDALAAGNAVQFGKTLFFEPVAGNRARTQFKVLVSVEGGASTEQVMVTGADGRAVPLLLDPGLLLSNIKRRNQAVEQDAKDADSYRQARNRDLIKQYGQTDTPDSPGLNALINDPLTFSTWFVDQPEAWKKQFTENEISFQQMLKKSADRRQDLEKTMVPEGMRVDPALLGTPKAAGKGVVLGAVEQVERLFPDGTGGQFMVNVAAAESSFGTADNAFRASGDRGIWQVNDSGDGAFMEIKRRVAEPGDPLAAAAAKVKQQLGIDIATLVPSDLEKPLVSAVMARLYFLRVPNAIPADAQAQAEFWREHYNPGATDDMVAHFASVANSLLVTPAYASADFDASGPGLVTDVSGSPYPQNFLDTQSSTQTSALRLSAAFGQPLRVTPHGGTRRGGSPTSQHRFGTALDIYVADMSDADKTRLIATAIAMGYRGIGGYGAGAGVGTIHLDLRTYGRHGGLALWWRHKAGVDGDWATGEKWYVDGVKQGAAMKGLTVG
jgi:hypothetical protein